MTFSAPAGSPRVIAAVQVVNDTGDTAYVCAWMDRWDGTGEGNTVFDTAADAANTGVCETVADNNGSATTATFEWAGMPAVDGSTYLRFRVCTTLTECNEPTGATVPLAAAGEVEDYQLDFDFNPTSVTIGEVELEAVRVSEALDMLDIANLSDAELFALLSQWIEGLDGLNRDELLALLRDYLDPDGDGNLAVLRWQTLEERGTIGFFVDRKQDVQDDWVRINNGAMPPGLITAPLGGEYLLFDPDVQAGMDYLYRLIEQEDWGTTKEYRPYLLRQTP